ncbi:chemotaxis protein CheW [Vibrio sp.]|nr:chemotaxis protein CheW [Vibrio sp.]
MSNEAKEYLSFIIENEEYALDILDVREVRGWADVRPLPNSPPHIMGMLELRGEYIPIIDLRQSFGFEKTEISSLTVVILLNFNDKTVGIIVDAVADVYPIDDQHIQPPPMTGDINNYDYIRGMCQINDKHIILIEIEKLFDLQALDQATTHSKM